MTVEYWMEQEMEQEDFTQKIKIVSRETMVRVMRLFDGVYLDSVATDLQKGWSFSAANGRARWAVEKHDQNFAKEHPHLAGLKCQIGQYETCLETFSGQYVGQEGISYKSGRYIFARDSQNFIVAYPLDSKIVDKIEEALQK